MRIDNDTVVAGHHRYYAGGIIRACVCGRLRAPLQTETLSRRNDVERRAWRSENASAWRGHAQDERTFSRRAAEALPLVDAGDEDAAHDHHDRRQGRQRDDESKPAEQLSDDEHGD